jgi:tRNA (guanine37-N1)-methyltransferase
MYFDVLTIIPESFDSYLNSSILARAQAKEIIEVNIHNLRNVATDPHRTVDDRPYGGGAGMVMRVDILAKAIKALVPRKNKKTRVIALSAQGTRFTQRKAEELAAKYDRVVLVCGRYEGFDARAELLFDEEISVGDYVLTGGELPAMIIIDSVSRLLNGVLGKEASLDEESFGVEHNVLEYPHYTRPEVFAWKGKKHAVPKVLLSGNHADIKKWRQEESLNVTKKKRPDLIKE